MESTLVQERIVFAVNPWIDGLIGIGLVVTWVCIFVVIGLLIRQWKTNHDFQAKRDNPWKPKR
jgi:hypothetical protein